MLRILALSGNDWNGMWMNRQQILSRLAARHSVYYCTGACNVWDRHGSSWQVADIVSRTKFSDGALIDYPGKLVSRWPKYGALDSTAIKVTARRWQKNLSSLPGERKVLYLFHPSFWPYVEHLDFDKLVYHAYDLFSDVPDIGKQNLDFEKRLAQRADQVFASSEAIAEKLRNDRNGEVTVIPNGVDYDAYSGEVGPPPADIADIPRPRIAYVGRINTKVDLGLIIDLAQQNPSYSFMFVGPVSNLDATGESQHAALTAMPNVHFLGPKPHEVLPQYARNIDVGLMCYKANTKLWVNAGDPLKMYEYLAAGLPVVSSDLPSVRHVDHVIDIAKTQTDWNQLIKRSLDATSDEDVKRRREFANRFDWCDISSEVEKHLLAMF